MLVWSFATCLELPLPLKELSAKHKSATKPQRLKKNTIEKILKFSNTQGKLVILLPPKKGRRPPPDVWMDAHKQRNFLQTWIGLSPKKSWHPGIFLAWKKTHNTTTINQDKNTKKKEKKRIGRGICVKYLYLVQNKILSMSEWKC